MSSTGYLSVGSWTDAGFTAANFNSLADGSGVLAATAISNSTTNAVHERADVSFSLVVGGTTTVASYFAIYALPLNQDGTTYGDGYASGAGDPETCYYLGSVGVKSGIASGSAVTGTLELAGLPAGDFKVVLVNHLGVALNSAAAAVVKYQFVDLYNA